MGRILAIEKDQHVALSSLWLKTVQAVDLDVHCINSLIGDRIPVDRAAEFQRVDLEEHPAPAWYLCGLPQPYRWALNSHALLLPAEPDHFEEAGIGHGIRITLQGVRLLRPEADWITAADAAARYDRDAAFVTCRNLQAAHHLHDQLGLEDRPNPERDRYRRRKTRPAAGQTSLFT